MAPLNGHLNQTDLAKFKNGMASGTDFVAPKNAEPRVNCLKGKQTRLPFPKKRGSRATSMLEIYYSFGFMRSNGSKFLG